MNDVWITENKYTNVTAINLILSSTLAYFTEIDPWSIFVERMVLFNACTPVVSNLLEAQVNLLFGE